jgi:hypothetical protein
LDNRRDTGHAIWPQRLAAARNFTSAESSPVVAITLATLPTSPFQGRLWPAPLQCRNDREDGRGEKRSLELFTSRLSLLGRAQAFRLDVTHEGVVIKSAWNSDPSNLEFIEGSLAVEWNSLWCCGATGQQRSV